MPEIYRESQGFALAEIHAGQLALFENGALQMDSFQVGNHETATSFAEWFRSDNR